MCTLNSQILIVICSIHLHINHMSRIPFLILSFLDQQIDRQSALQTTQKNNNARIPFTLTFHPHNHAVNSTILKMIPILVEPFRSLHLMHPKQVCTSIKFTCNVEKISGPKPSIKITDWSFRLYLSQCHLLHNLHSLKNASKPVARHFNFLDHSKQHIALCGLSLH